MALPTHISPAKMYWIRAFGWGGLRAILELNPETHSKPLCIWGKHFPISYRNLLNWVPTVLVPPATLRHRHTGETPRYDIPGRPRPLAMPQVATMYAEDGFCCRRIESARVFLGIPPRTVGMSSQVTDSSVATLVSFHNVPASSLIDPSTGRSHDAADQAIDAILALEKRLKEVENRAKELENKLAKPGVTSDILDISIELSESHGTITRLSNLIRIKRSSLGVSEKARIWRLKDDELLQVKVNARAVKTRLRDRLWHCKFELERLERSYRQTMNSEPLQLGFISTTDYVYPRQEAQHANGRGCQAP